MMLKRCRTYGSEGGEGQREEHNVAPGGKRIIDEHHDGFGIVSSTSDSGGFIERLRHTTGASLPVSPPPNDWYSARIATEIMKRRRRQWQQMTEKDN
jgi:hypothetical protein